MQTIGDRIRAKRKSLKMSMQDLAGVMGKSKSNISEYESGKYEPSAQTVAMLSRALNVSADWILTGQEFLDQNLSVSEFLPPTIPSVTEENLLASFKKLPDKYKERTLERIEIFLEESTGPPAEPESHFYSDVPDPPDIVQEESSTYITLLYGKISAGGGVDAIENKEEVCASVHCDFALQVKGDSMEPVFKNGSIIFLNQADSIDYNGEVAAVIVEDMIPQAYLKKVYIEKDTIRLVSVNSTYPEMKFPSKNVRIFGKIAGQK